MCENEVPDEIAEALEHAADILQSTLPTGQAAASAASSMQPTIRAMQSLQATGAAEGLSAFSTILEPMRKWSEYQAEQIDRPLRMIAAYQAAQLSQTLGGPIRMMAAYQAAQLSQTLGGPLRLMVAYQAAQLSEVLRTARPLILFAQQWAELDRTVQAMAVGPLLPYADQIDRARAIGLAQLAERANHPLQDHTAEARLTVTPTFTAVGEVTKAAPTEHRRAAYQAALVIALVWILAVTMPAAELKLSPEAQEYLNGLYATIGLALIITWRVNDNRKH